MKKISLLILILVGCQSPLPPESPAASETEAVFSYEVDGISFETPEGWAIIDSGLYSHEHEAITSGELAFMGDFFWTIVENPRELPVQNLFESFSDSSGRWFELYEHEVFEGGLQFNEFQESGEDYYRQIVIFEDVERVIVFNYVYIENKHQDEFDAWIESVEL